MFPTKMVLTFSPFRVCLHHLVHVSHILEPLSLKFPNLIGVTSLVSTKLHEVQNHVCLAMWDRVMASRIIVTSTGKILIPAALRPRVQFCEGSLFCRTGVSELCVWMRRSDVFISQFA